MKKQYILITESDAKTLVRDVLGEYENLPFVFQFNLKIIVDTLIIYKTCSETSETPPDKSFFRHALSTFLEIHTVFLRKIDFA